MGAESRLETASPQSDSVRMSRKVNRIFRERLHWLIGPQEEIRTPHILHSKSIHDFDLMAFSRMKFGSWKDLKQFGEEIAISLEPETLDDNTILTSVGFDDIKPSGVQLAHHTLSAINRSRPYPIRFVKLAKHNWPDADYGSLSLRDRTRSLQTTQYSIDPRLIRGKHLIVIDDIRVTGGHEEVIRKALGKYPRRITFAYAASLSGWDNPNLEQEISVSAVQTLDNLKAIMFSEGFTITSKLCKFILAHPDKEGIRKLLSELPESTLFGLQSGVINSGYAQMDTHAGNFTLLQEVCKEKGL